MEGESQLQDPAVRLEAIRSLWRASRTREWRAAIMTLYQENPSWIDRFDVNELDALYTDGLITDEEFRDRTVEVLAKTIEKQ